MTAPERADTSGSQASCESVRRPRIKSTSVRVTARDFDKLPRTLIICKDKNGNARHITVPPVIADFFAE